MPKWSRIDVSSIDDKEIESNLSVYRETKRLKPDAMSDYVNAAMSSGTNVIAGQKENGTFTFTSSGSVKVYYKHVDSTGNESLSNPINVLKNGTSYTIEKIKSDIYIEVK